MVKKPKQSSKKSGPSKGQKKSVAPLKVWRPGVDDVEDEEEMTYDPTAYSCLQNFTLDWPALSFDFITDDWGAPRNRYPHKLMFVSGTQAATAKQNYIIIAKITNITQGRHGDKSKKTKKDKDLKETEMMDQDQKQDDDELMDKDDDKGSELSAQFMASDEEDSDEEAPEQPPLFHYRKIQHNCGVNRIRSMPQNPAVIALQGDDGMVCVYDTSQQLLQVSQENKVTKPSQPTERLKPLFSHSLGKEGYALSFSPLQNGRFASGNNNGKIFVYDIQNGQTWQPQGPYLGHTKSVEDIQWSSTEPTIFMSCGADRTIRVWDTRARDRVQLTVQASETSDINVISWNPQVTYMIASGSDDGQLKVYDLREFSSESHVANFTYHQQPITSVQWCPQQSEMLAASTLNQVTIWDLALERDPEEEQMYRSEAQQDQQAQIQQEIPPQLLFEHGGQDQLREVQWHPQIPGMILSTAQNGFNVFKPINVLGDENMS